METDQIIAKATSGGRITPQEALFLYDRAPLAKLACAATKIKEQKSGRNVYYNRNIHIEPTNVCLFNCRFCSYRRPAGDPQSWHLTLNEIEALAANHKNSGITEVHIVGGVHPDHTLDYYVEMIKTVKKTLPAATIKAFTAIELGFMIEKAGITITSGLRRLKSAGMEAIPGGGAEIFDEEIRSKICPEKGGSKLWLEIHEAAHREGISTNATMLYGHIETPSHRIDHMLRLRELQDRTGGFNAFIPLKYRNTGNSMFETGEVSTVEDLRTLAISRLFLDNFPHIKAYWPMYGRTTTELSLAFGADDIDGTIGDTTKIYSMAGAEDQKPVMTICDLENMAHSAGYEAVERDTFYNCIPSLNSL